MGFLELPWMIVGELPSAWRLQGQHHGPDRILAMGRSSIIGVFILVAWLVLGGPDNWLNLQLIRRDVTGQRLLCR